MLSNRALHDSAVLPLGTAHSFEIAISYPLEERFKIATRCYSLLSRYERLEKEFHRFSRILRNFGFSIPSFISLREVRIKVRWFFSQHMEGEALDYLNLYLAQGGKKVAETVKKLREELIHIQQNHRRFTRVQKQLLLDYARLKNLGSETFPSNWVEGEKEAFRLAIRRHLESISLPWEPDFSLENNIFIAKTTTEQKQNKTLYLLAEAITRLRQEKIAITANLLKKGIHPLKSAKPFSSPPRVVSKEQELPPYEPSHRLEQLLSHLVIAGYEKEWRIYNMAIRKSCHNNTFSSSFEEKLLVQIEALLNQHQRQRESNSQIEELIDLVAAFKKPEVKQTVEELKKIKNIDSETLENYKGRFNRLFLSETKKKETHLRQRGLIDSLTELGYLDLEDVAQNLSLGNKVYVNKVRWGKYHIEIRTNRSCSFLEMRLIRFIAKGLVPALPELERKWEETFRQIWETDCLQLAEKMEKRGLKIDLVKMKSALPQPAEFSFSASRRN